METRWLLALGVLCLLCAGATCWVGRTRDFIGSPDQAAYAEQADNLLAGHGFTIGYVQHFYHRYADVRHAEDHYSPGAGVMLALAFRLFGRSEFSAIIPSILFACLLLPCLSYLLARRLSVPPPLAFACAVTVIFALPMREHAFYALADLPFAVCILAVVVLSLDHRSWSTMGAGACLSAAFYLKPTALLFLPIFLLIYLILHWPARTHALRSFLLCGSVFLLLIAPWLARNWATFHDPLYTANKYVAAGIDYDSNFWNAQFAKVWWADPAGTPPELTSLLHRYGLRQVCAVFAFRLNRALFVVSGWASVSIFLSLLTVLLLLLRRWRRVRLLPESSDGSRMLERKMLAVSLACVLFVLILCLTFSVRARYLLPVIPIGMTLAWALVAIIVQRLSTVAIPYSRFQSLLVTIAITLCASAAGVVELAQQLAGTIPIQRDDMQVKRPARWAAQHLPHDARVMSQEAWQFRYYAQRGVVNVPCDTPERIQAVIDAYRIQYLFLWESPENRQSIERLRPYLAAYPGEWQTIRPPGEYFTLCIRRNAPWPTGMPHQK